MIGIQSWVRPASAGEHETIVGRIVHIPPDPSELGVVWLSNQRGMWRNYEAVEDLVEIPVPDIGLIEALMVSIDYERRVQA